MFNELPLPMSSKFSWSTFRLEWEKLRRDLFQKQRSKYKVGDWVIEPEQKKRCTIVEIHTSKNYKEPILYCTRFDDETRTLQNGFYYESRVEQISTKG